MKIEVFPIERVIPYVRNPRKNALAVDKVAASLKEFGWKQPIVVDAEFVIIVGHTRWLAAKKLGMADVPVLVATDLSPAKVKAYRIADNRTNQEAEWDEELLALELGELTEQNLDLSLTAFNPDEIAAILARATAVEEGLTDEDDCPETSENPVSQLGDIWLLGRHRVMCGDSLSLDAVDKLMGNEKADLVFTDPPYNVNYEGCTKEKLTIKNDNMSEAEFTQFLKDAFASYLAAIKKGASLYICHSSMYAREFHNALEANGFVVRTQLIWAKSTFAWGFGRYKFQHEPIYYCYLKGQTDPWYGDKTQSTLWKVDKPTANKLHPTMKPVSLVEIALQNSSKAGDIVLDLFGGSGSTLIACERAGRNARLMELDPKYVDVIIKRWQAFTGQNATLQATGQPFKALA